MLESDQGSFPSQVAGKSIESGDTDISFRISKKEYPVSAKDTEGESEVFGHVPNSSGVY